MATAYTPILQLALPVTGELNGTWGTVVNDNITSMIEQAIAGLATINTWTTASHTLTTANGTTDEARCAVLECSGTPGAAATVICPAFSKVYVIKNSVTGGYAVTLKTSAGTGISVPNGSTALLYCDGTNVVSGSTYMETVSTPHVDITAQGDLRLQDTTGGQYVALQAPTAITTSFTLTLPADDGTAGQVLTTDGSGVLSWSGASVGDVVGPASATANAVPSFSGTTGKLIQNNSGVTISAGVVTATGFAGPLNGSVGATTPAAVTATQVDITAQGDLRLQDTTGGQYVAIQAPGTLAANYTLTLPADDGTPGQLLATDGSGGLSWTSAGTGDVVGPASATDNAVARFDLATGKLIQNSVVTIADTTGNMAGVGTLGVGAITTSGALTYGGVTLNNAVTGTGNMVLSTSPTLVTPVLGTPASGTVTNLTGTASININGTVGATTASTVVATQVDITAQGDLRLQDTTGGQYVALQAPTVLAANYTLTLPVDDGTPGQSLLTDGSGVLSWGTPTIGTATDATITTSTAASAFKVPFANTTASTTGNYGLLQDSTATFTYNPSTNTLTADTFAGALTGSATQLGGVAAASYAQLGTTQTFTGAKTFTGGIESTAFNMATYVSMYGSIAQIDWSIGTSSVNNRMTLYDTGDLTIQGANATKASGTTWINPSDARLKDNVVSYTKGLNELVQIQPKSFTFNGKAGSAAGLNAVGIIADEIQQVLPNTVQKRLAKLNPDDAQQTEIKYFDASELTWVMVNAIKELSAKVDQLQTEIAALKP